MEELRTVIDEIIKSVSFTVNKLELEEVNKLVDLLIEAKKNDRKIMVIGAGRSGLVGRAFAMRLMHLNFNVHVVGETITPAVERNDILLAISGSGTTTVIVTAARIAKKVGARIVAITSHRNSPLGKRADHTVVIRGRTKLAKDRDYFSRQILGVHEPLAPLGTVFEVASTVFLDSLVVVLMRKLGKTERDLRARHATIE